MSRQSYPVLTLTITAGDTVSANRFVTFAGAHAGDDANAFGVSRNAAASGAQLSVDVLGTAVVEIGEAVTAGDTVSCDSVGRAKVNDTSAAKVGIALDSGTVAGQFIEVLLIPNVA